MLPDFIIDEILKREKQEKERRWEPVPLYLPIDDVPYPPRRDSAEEETSEKRIDLWDRDEKSDIIVIQTSYKPCKSYQN